MAHTSSCRNTRIEPLKPVSTCFEEIRETEGSLLFPVSRVGPPSGPFRSNESIYTVPLYPTRYSDLIQTCLIRVIFCVACNLYIAYDPKIPSRSLSRSSYPSRNFRVFFLSRPSPRTEWYSFEISMGDCYRIPALVQVCLRFTAWNEQQIAQRSDFYSNEQRTARTAMAKHARDLPRDNLLVNQNDAWRYKVTRQRTRLTINFNTRHHQISRRWLSTLAPHWRWSVSIGIGYRTTNAPFTNDDHPWRSRSTDLSRSLRIIILLLILHTWSYPIIAWFPQFSRHRLKVLNWNCESIIEKDACKTETATFTGIKAKGAAVNVKHWQKGRGGTKEKNETAERAR